MKLVTSRFAILAAAWGIVLASCAVGQAGLLPAGKNVATDGDNFRYTYGVILTSDCTLKTGDFFTVYDFQGFVPGTNVQPANFTFSIAKTGKTPPGTNPID